MIPRKNITNRTTWEEPLEDEEDHLEREIKKELQAYWADFQNKIDQEKRADNR